MSVTIRLVIVSLAFLACLSAQAEDKWRPLFNGKDLEGWKHVGPGSFQIEDGLLKTEGGMGLLWYTREKFGNGNRLAGPAIIEQVDSTIIIPPGQKAYVDRFGNVIIEVAG